MSASDPAGVRSGWVVVALCMVAVISFSLFRWGLGVLFPFIHEELGTSRAELGLITSGLALGTGATSLLAGWLVDVVGVRRLLTAAMIGAGVAVFLFSRIQSPVQAVLLGTLIGGALAVVVPCYMKAFMDWVMPGRRTMAVGSVEASMPVSGIIAGVFISILTVTLGWRGVVEVLSIVIMISCAVFFVFYRDKPQSGDVEGRTRSGTTGRMSQVARNWDFWVSCVYGVSQAGVGIVLVSYLVLFLREELDMSTVLAGTCLAVAMAGSAVGRIGWGLVSDLLLQRRRVVTLALVGILSAVSMAFMASLPADASLIVVLALVFVAGCTANGSSILIPSQQGLFEMSPGVRRWSGAEEATGCRLLASPPYLLRSGQA